MNPRGHINNLRRKLTRFFSRLFLVSDISEVVYDKNINQVKRGSLLDKTVLITGASSGLGAALARIYAASGARLFLAGRNADRLGEIYADCRRSGAEFVETKQVDVMNAADLADWIVKNIGKTFRQSHEISGKIVLLAEKQKKKLHELDLKLMQSIEPKITKDVYTFLSPINSINQKKSY